MSEIPSFVVSSSETFQTPLFSEDLKVANLRKGLETAKRSAFKRETGRIPHPIIMENAIQLALAVNIQETCIRAKRDATVGLGFETEEEREGRRRKKELADRSHEIAMQPPGSAAPSIPPKKKPAVKKKKVTKEGEEIEVLLLGGAWECDQERSC